MHKFRSVTIPKTLLAACPKVETDFLLSTLCEELFLSHAREREREKDGKREKSRVKYLPIGNGNYIIIYHKLWL